jgi:hypothetical protein
MPGFFDLAGEENELNPNNLTLHPAPTPASYTYTYTCATPYTLHATPT